jgi:putative transposase
VIGVDCEGVKNVLGIWVQNSEGAKFWAGVCAELRNRGVKDIIIACCDGLKGACQPFCVRSQFLLGSMRPG